MTAAGGGPALRDAAASGSAGHGDAEGRKARFADRRLRTVLSLARVEASALVRSPLVLAGLCGGGVVVWVRFGQAEPVWWNAAWQIGEGQLVLAVAVLVAAHLAAGRARRDAMNDLYSSFPATAGTRTFAHLAGLAGAVPASLLLIAAAAAVAQWRGAIGVPSLAVLTGGMLLVIVAGAVGTAVGIRFPHPLAGVLAAIVLFAPIEQNNLPDPVTLLFPWKISLQLSPLPGPLAGYPPATAHAAELAGIAAVAAVVALAMTVRGARARGGLVTGGVLALAVIVVAGAVELRPIPTAELNHLVAEAVDPAASQRCTISSQVRYCFYPGFGSQLPSLEAPVNRVLARLPARPDSPLTVRQVASLYLPDDALTHGHSRRQVSRWEAQLLTAPGNVGTASAIYLPVGSWPAAGGELASAQFDVALATADWAVRIPPQSVGSMIGSEFLACVPVNQAREAIAIWLAILATHPPAAELQNGLRSGPSHAVPSVAVRNASVATWSYPGSNADYVTPQEAPQTTAAGYLLASAMTRLPQQKVIRILSGGWATWLDWHTTDAQLATKLGIRMPAVPSFPPPSSGGTTVQGQGGPQDPLCTS